MAEKQDDYLFTQLLTRNTSIIVTKNIIFVYYQSIYIFVVVYTTIKMLKPEYLTDNFFFIIGAINNQFNNKINKLFRETNLHITVEQFSILALLWYKEGYNQQEIAKILSRDKTTITRILNNLVNRNLIVKIPNNSDKRNNLIYLTNKGKQLQYMCVQLTGNEYDKALNKTTDDDLNITINTLKKILNNID